MSKRRTRRKKRPLISAESVLAAALGTFLAFWCITALTARMSPALSTLAKTQVEQAVAEAAAGRVQEALAAQGGAVVMLEQDEAGRATALKADTTALNRVRSELVQGLSRDLEGLRRKKIGVPLGSLTPWQIVHGIGPEVKVGIYTTPAVTAEFSSHFSQAGVNQTRHVIELEVTVTLQLLLPGGTETQEIKTVAPVAETIIVGTPPEEYWQAGT